MKSIKPGRGPSMMGGIMSLLIGLFGVIWTVGALSIGAPIFFAGFGLIFVATAVVNAIYNFKNATGKNRYSAFDITDTNEEPDPLNELFGEKRVEAPSARQSNAVGYCPYCGEPIQKQDYEFCPKCGKELP